ncbi:MAG TPA: hypothetical protein VN848_00605 [Gemmatimonadales bacterium]|nr:hypothetical protein [Gemmatimonadales bacterium]
MSARRWSMGLVIAAMCGGGVARAQDSQFSIAGLGTPGRLESVRSRSTGGAFAAFDPESPFTDAALVDLRNATATAAQGASFRDVSTPGSSTWLRTTRFPVLSLGGPLSNRLVVGVSFSTYLDQTYDAVTRDSQLLRGTMQPFNNSISSDGGVTDVRLAAALRIGSRLAVGLGFHDLAGSTRQNATRIYDDTTDYVTVVQTGTVTYSGWGISGGAILRILPTAAIAVFARQDQALHSHVGDSLVATNNLPATYGGALMLTPEPTLRIAGSVDWQSWSRTGAGAFNTMAWSAGLEIGRTTPLRIGVRGDQLPFGPGTSAPTETGVAVGTSTTLAKGHGVIDVGLERLSRSGSGLQEEVWTLLVGVTVRP